jgi:hypothetical protein
MELKSNSNRPRPISQLGKSRSRYSMHEVMKVDPSQFSRTIPNGRSVLISNSSQASPDMKSILSKFHKLKETISSKNKNSDLPSQVDIIEIELTQLDFGLRNLCDKNQFLEMTVEKLQKSLREKQDEMNELQSRYEEVCYRYSKYLSEKQSFSLDNQSSIDMDLHKESIAKDSSLEETPWNAKESEYISMIKELQHVNAKLKMQVKGYKQTVPLDNKIYSRNLKKSSSSNSPCSNYITRSMSPIYSSPHRKAKIGEQEKFMPFLANVNKLWMNCLRSDTSASSRSLENTCPARLETAKNPKIGRSVAREIVEQSLKQQIIREKLKRQEKMM